MGRRHSFPREELIRLRRTWATQNRWPITLVLGLTVAFVAMLAMLCWLLHYSAAVSFFLGFTSGGLMAATVAMLFISFLAHEQAGILQLRGAWSEENTRDVLSSAKRKGHVVDWVDSIPLQYGDLDHVLVTRSGEVVLIDSKWRSRGSVQGASDMAASARKGRQRTEAVLRSVLPAERGRHRTPGTSTPVTAIIVIWGAAQQGLNPGATVDGIEFVGGRKLGRWLSGRSRARADKQTARDALTKLEAFRATVQQRQASPSSPK